MIICYVLQDSPKVYWMSFEQIRVTAANKYRETIEKEAHVFLVRIERALKGHCFVKNIYCQASILVL